MHGEKELEVARIQDPDENLVCLRCPWHNPCSHGNATTPTPTADGYPVSRGLFAEEAVKLLQSFYLSGNPAGKQTMHSVLDYCHLHAVPDMRAGVAN